MERQCSKCKSEIMSDELSGYVQIEYWCGDCICVLLRDAKDTLGYDFVYGGEFYAEISYDNLRKLITDIACSIIE